MRKLLTENIAVRYWRYMTTWREHRDTIKLLNAMSNRELKDIGICRGDINGLIFREDERV